MWVYSFNKYLKHHNWYIVRHIIYGKVYSLLKLTSRRASFVVVLDDQECVWRHFRSNCYGEGLSGGTLSHPSLEDPYTIWRLSVFRYTCKPRNFDSGEADPTTSPSHWVPLSQWEGGVSVARHTEKIMESAFGNYGRLWYMFTRRMRGAKFKLIYLQILTSLRFFINKMLTRFC